MLADALEELAVSAPLLLHTTHVVPRGLMDDADFTPAVSLSVYVYQFLTEVIEVRFSHLLVRVLEGLPCLAGLLVELRSWCCHKAVGTLGGHSRAHTSTQ